MYRGVEAEWHGRGMEKSSRWQARLSWKEAEGQRKALEEVIGAEVKEARQKAAT